MPSLCAWLAWLVIAPPADLPPRALSFEAALGSGAGAAEVRGASQAAAVAAKGTREQPLLSANPVVNAQLGARVNPSDEEGFEGTLGISQPLSTRSLGRQRKVAMGSEARWRAARVDEVRLQRDLAIAFAWLELRRAEELQVLASSRVEVEVSRAAEIERLVSAGERPAPELADARAELSRARLAELDAEGRGVDAAHALGRALGQGDGRAVATRGPLPEAALPSTRDREALLDLVEQMPSVRTTELLAAAEEARGVEAWASAAQQVSVGVQVQRESMGSTIVQGTVSVPIPALRSGVRDRTVHQAAAAELRGQAADQAVQLRAQLRTMFHDVEHTDQVHADLRASVLPSSEEALNAWERQAASGEVLHLHVLDARRRLLEVRLREIDARVDRAWARVRLAIFAAVVGGAA